MSKVVLGIENIDNFKHVFEGKRVGLITNPTGIDSNFKSSIDILREKTNLINTLYTIALSMVFVFMWSGRTRVLKLNKTNQELYDVFLLIYMIVPITRIMGWIVNMQALFNRVSMYFFTSLIILIPYFFSS